MMKLKSNILVTGILLVWMLFFTEAAMAQTRPAITIRSTVSQGYWNSPSTWDQGRIPTIDDVVLLDRPVRMRGHGATVRGLVIENGGQLRGRNLYYRGSINVTDYFENHGVVGGDLSQVRLGGVIDNQGLLNVSQLHFNSGPIHLVQPLDTPIVLLGDLSILSPLRLYNFLKTNGHTINSNGHHLYLNDVQGDLGVAGSGSIFINGIVGEEVTVDAIDAPESFVFLSAPTIKQYGDITALTTYIDGQVQMKKTGLTISSDVEISETGSWSGEAVWVRHAVRVNGSLTSRGAFGPYVYPYITDDVVNLGEYLGQEIRLGGSGEKTVVGDFPTTIELHSDQTWMTSPTVITYQSNGHVLTLPDDVTLRTTNIPSASEFAGDGSVVIVDPSGDGSYSPNIQKIIGENINLVFEASNARLADNIRTKVIEIRDAILASDDIVLEADQVAFVGGSLSGYGNSREYNITVDTPDLSGSGHLGPFTDWRIYTDIPLGFTAGWNTNVKLEHKGAGFTGTYRLAGVVADFLDNAKSVLVSSLQPNLRDALNTGQPHYYSYQTDNGWTGALTLNAGYNPFNTSSGIAKRNFFQFSFVPNQDRETPFEVTVTTPTNPGYSGTVRLVALRGEIYPRTIELEDGYWQGEIVLFHTGGGQQVVAEGIGSHVGYSGRTNYFHVVDPDPATGSGQASGQIRGVVRNSDGSRANHGTVTLTSDTVLEQYVANIDIDGTYQMDLPADTYHVETTDGLRQTIQVPTDELVAHDIVLNRTCEPTDKIPVLLVPGIEGSDRIGETGWFPRLTKHAPEWDANVLEIHNPELPLVVQDPGGWNDIRTLLTQNGYEQNCTFFNVPYDWSLSVPDIAEQYLQPWIDHAKQAASSTQVDIVAHSMGGLVSRAYIQGDDYDDDVRKLAMVGTPNQGSAMSYFSWEGGDPVAADQYAAIPTPLLAGLFQSMTITLNHAIKTEEESPLCQTSLLGTFTGGMTCDRNRTKQFLWDHAPSVGNLYPTYDFLFAENTDGQYQATMPTFTNNFLQDLNNQSLGTSTEIKLFVGTGFDTVRNVYVDSDSKGDTIYTDGEVLYTSTAPGDETVTMESVRWDESVHFSDSQIQEHISLILAYGKEIIEFLSK